MRLIFTSIATISFLWFPALVAAQTTPSQDNSPSFEPPGRIPRNPSAPAAPPKPPEQYEKKIQNIRNQVSSDKEVKAICADYMIEYQFFSDKLRIETGNNNCAFSIIQEVIQPQLTESKIRTYEYTGDREGVIVTF